MKFNDYKGGDIIYGNHGDDMNFHLIKHWTKQ